MSRTVIRHPRHSVAVIGAGPAGLACGRWLLQAGFEPVLIDAAAGIGGQWNQGQGHSGVWPGMRTNTCRTLTSFSDLPYPDGTPLFPRHDQVLAYLADYAARFGLDRRVRAGTRVQRLEQAGDGWRLELLDAHGALTQEEFPRVIIATGRQACAAMPDLPGGAQFIGEAGVRHAGRYRGPEPYRGRDVVVGGCSISALEIASDLALGGANRVVLAARRMRYVLPKLLGGVPTDVAMFTRGAAMAAERLPVDALRSGLKAMLVQAGAQPSTYGALAADEDPFVAGVSQAQHFLPLVAEGRIEVRPWIERLAGSDVHFSDGSRCRADGVVLGTGYRLHLPFLAPAIAATLDLDEQHIDLYEHTFHPDLPGLAFVGLYDQTGPMLPVLELQARWIAYASSSRIAPPTEAVMRGGVERYRAGRGGPQGVMMHAMALRFARLAGVEPDLSRWPRLAQALTAGPLSSVSFRLEGPDALAEAPERVRVDAQPFVASPEESPEGARAIAA